MIKLSVEEKCQNCPEFFPVVAKVDITNHGEERRLMQMVYCSSKELCESLEKHLSKKGY